MAQRVQCLRYKHKDWSLTASTSIKSWIQRWVFKSPVLGGGGRIDELPVRAVRDPPQTMRWRARKMAS